MSALRSLIDLSVNLLGALLKNRRVKPDIKTNDGLVCVNLGCGLSVAPGWINVDASLNALFAGAPQWGLALLHRVSGASRYYSLDEYCRLLSQYRFVFHDLSRSLPFSSNSIDVFYSSHFLEHLFRHDAHRLMQDVFFALRHGGVVRIAVPDLEHAIALYSSGEKRRMLNDYFFVDDLSSYLARHKYMYDFELLESMLLEIGFKNIRQCNYQDGTVPDLVYLDNRPGETLFVEANR